MTSPYDDWPKVGRVDSDISICSLIDEEDVPSLGVLLRSFVLNSNVEKSYSFFVLHMGLDDEHILSLKGMVEGRVNISIAFINVQEMMDYELFPKDASFVIAEYLRKVRYRLAIPWLFRDYKKLVYLEPDTVLLCDVSELHDMDLGGNPLAAPRDYKSIARNGIDDNAREYMRDVIQSKHPADYFCTGVMIINIAEFVKEASFDNLVRMTASREWKNHDQDVLNKVFDGRVTIIPAEYGLVDDIDDVNKHLPKKLRDEYERSRKNPKIVLYPGKHRPWRTSHSQVSSYFWRYAAETQFFGELLGRVKSDTLYRLMIFDRFLSMKIDYVYDDARKSVVLTSSGHILGSMSDFRLEIDKLRISGDEIQMTGFGMVPPDCILKDLGLEITNNGRNVKAEFRRLQHKVGKIRLYDRFWFSTKIELSEGKNTIRFYNVLDGKSSQYHRFQFGNAAPLENDFSCSYYHKDGRTCRLERDRIIVDESDTTDVVAREIKFLNEIRRKRSLGKALLVFGARGFTRVGRRLKGKRELWLFSDRVNKAADNGEVFFEYCVKMKGGNRYRFVINRDAKDEPRMRSIGKVIHAKTIGHKLAWMLADKNIFSQFNYWIIWFYKEFSGN